MADGLDSLAEMSIDELFKELTSEPSEPAHGRTREEEQGELFGAGGPLRASDLARYKVDGPDSWSQTERISYRHHRFAQLVALGHTGVEISEMLGMTQASVTRLKASPGVKELVLEYSSKVLEYDQSFQLKIQAFRDMTLEEVEKQIGEGKLKGKDLAQVLFNMMDRTGYGPKKTEDVNLNLGVSTDRLYEMRKTYDGANSARIIEDAIDVTSTLPARPLPNAQTENLRLGVGPEGEEVTSQFLNERDDARTKSRAKVREKVRKDALETRDGGKCLGGYVNCAGGRYCPHSEEGEEL